MTNKEKARELAGQLLADDQNQQPLIDVLLQMAQWKEDEMVKWVENNYSIYVQTYADVGGYISSDFDIDRMLTDLRNAMEID